MLFNSCVGMLFNNCVINLALVEVDLPVLTLVRQLLQSRVVEIPVQVTKDPVVLTGRYLHVIMLHIHNTLAHQL